MFAAVQAFLNGLPPEAVGPFRDRVPADPRPRDLASRALPCLRWLPRIAEVAPPATKTLVETTADNAPMLYWGQTYRRADFGAAFLENYGWMELFGTRGHFACETMAGGFLLLGPDTHYPEHRHVAEEIYVPLTNGTAWRTSGSAFASRPAGSIIHHRSNVGHAMRTGPEPLLALYLWRGGPLAQRSEIGQGR